MKYVIMHEHQDTHVQISYKANFYNDDDVFSDTTGFNVAFGLSYFDGSPDFIEDPDYGTLVAKVRQWGSSDVDSVGMFNLSTHRCTNEDFNLDKDGQIVGD